MLTTLLAARTGLSRILVLAAAVLACSGCASHESTSTGAPSDRGASLTAAITDSLPQPPLSESQRAEITRRAKGLSAGVPAQMYFLIERNHLSYAGALDYIDSCWLIINRLGNLLREHPGEWMGVCDGVLAVGDDFDDIVRRLWRDDHMVVGCELRFPVCF